MARQEREVSIHKCLFDNNAEKVKRSMEMILSENSPNVGSIQAVRCLTEVYEFLINPSLKNDELHRAVGSSGCCEESQ